jgi:hypothetical protein
VGSRLGVLNAIAERLRGQAVRVESERCIGFSKGVVELALVQKRSSTAEVLSNCANELESFGHDVS